MRTSFLLLSALCVSTLVLSVSAATDLAAGAACSNADTCVAGYKCWLNVCTDQVNEDTPPSGFGNACAADNCCPSNSELVCNELTNRCGISTGFLPEIQCTAAAPGTVIPAAPAPTPETEPPTTPQTGLAVGATCSNIDTCVEGAKCWANVCTDRVVANSPPTGFGNSCSARDCCPQTAQATALVCNQATRRCGVSTAFLAEIACEVTPPGSGAAEIPGDDGTTPVTTPPTGTNPDGTTPPAGSNPDGTTTPVPIGGGSSGAMQQASINVFAVIALVAAVAIMA